MLSRCCKSDAIVEHGYYSCLKCYRACDIVLFNQDIQSEYSDYKKCRESIKKREIDIPFNKN